MRDQTRKLRRLREDTTINKSFQDPLFKDAFKKYIDEHQVTYMKLYKLVRDFKKEYTALNYESYVAKQEGRKFEPREFEYSE